MPSAGAFSNPDRLLPYTRAPAARSPLNDNVAGPPKTTQLEALHGLARALASGEFRARAVLERACAAVAGGFGFQRVGIVRFLPDTSTLVPFAGHGLTMDEIRALPPALPVGNFGAFARALAMRRAVYVEDPSTEEAVPEQIARDFGLGSFVIVPLTTDGRCLGFMTCDQRAERFLLDEAEVDLLTTFGTLIAGFPREGDRARGAATPERAEEPVHRARLARAAHPGRLGLRGDPDTGRARARAHGRTARRAPTHAHPAVGSARRPRGQPARPLPARGRRDPDGADRDRRSCPARRAGAERSSTTEPT